MHTMLDPIAATTPSAQPPQSADDGLDRLIDAACAKACEAIAPAWPLDRAIAVNPHWERVGHDVRTVAARLAVLGGVQVLPPRARVQEAWQCGRIVRADLEQALARLPEARAAGLDAEAAVAALSRAPALTRLPLLVDVLDDDPQGRRRLSWRQAITHQVSQACATYFDVWQSDWQPDRAGGLYTAWRETLTHDHGIGVLMGLPNIGQAVAALPATREHAERWALRRLGLREEVCADYLEAVLLTVHGWASWCAYLAWEARLAGGTDPHLRDLLAIRLAWGAVLVECSHDGAAQCAFDDVRTSWDNAPTQLRQARDALLVDEVWQLAFEIGYQRGLTRRLRAVAPPSRGRTSEQGIGAQAVFCIDVRSEPLRRALESTWPVAQTIGFAGFFGLPIAYSPLGTDLSRPQLPGLLAPTLQVAERVANSAADFSASGDALQSTAARARRHQFTRANRWEATCRWPGTAFSSVEAVGVGMFGALARLLHPTAAARRSLDSDGLKTRYRSVCRPHLVGLALDARIDLAASILDGIGIARRLAPLVLFVGHGSQSANNAQAAALDCGACCGQTGEVNARVLARLLNDPAVQGGLRVRGMALPAEISFVAALHNTTTDEVEGLDIDLLPDAARTRWEQMKAALVRASDQARRERAPALGLDPRAPHAALLDTLRRRANDPAQTRPEWGLAGNAAMILAPRARTLGAVLEGRVFLHDYDAARDRDGSVLESLMTAPMVVAHWINWQYHASTCEPAQFGSGNKLLHNVVGGRIGLFEGNGGDLRIGLSRQSLHDGMQWRHEPLRLTVVIDATSETIENVIRKHSIVRQLVHNGWLHLWRFVDDEGLERYTPEKWDRVDH